MTPLTKPVYRLTNTTYRGRAIIAGFVPGDLLELRLKGTRQRLQVTLYDLYWYSVKRKAAQLQAEKRASRKAKRELNKLTKRGIKREIN